MSLIFSFLHQGALLKSVIWWVRILLCGLDPSDPKSSLLPTRGRPSSFSKVFPHLQTGDGCNLPLRAAVKVKDDTLKVLGIELSIQ